jgi:peptidoglycan/LPS O-acetylase OafA/YrhL
MLFPIWAMGWAAYIIGTRRQMRSQALAWLLFLQPALIFLLLKYGQIGAWEHHTLTDMVGETGWRSGMAWSRFIISDTLLGASIALHLIGAGRLAPLLWLALHHFARPIRFAAARSFTLYLLHQPAMLLCGAILLPVALGPWRVWAVAAMTIAIVALVAETTESQRHRLRPWVARAIDQILRPWRNSRAI